MGRSLALAALTLVALALPGAVEGAYPGRNGRLVFASERGGSALGIFTASPNGTGLRRLTHHPSFGVDPAWAPDGRRLAFVRRVTRNAGPDVDPDWQPLPR